jgi:hypothetical protein
LALAANSLPTGPIYRACSFVSLCRFFFVYSQETQIDAYQGNWIRSLAVRSGVRSFNKREARHAVSGVGAAVTAGDTQTRFGWTAGGDIEYAFNNYLRGNSTEHPFRPPLVDGVREGKGPAEYV